MNGRRLKICYLAAGQGLLSTAGPTRNVLSLAKALQAHADVTVAFRYRLEDSPVEGLEVIELEPDKRPASASDDSATRGLSMMELLSYLSTLRRFVRASRGRFDLILEKSWLLSGHLSAYASRHGLPSIPVENVVPSPKRHAEAGLMKRLRVAVARGIAGHELRKASVIIAETEQLKGDMVRFWGIEPNRVVVIGLGVDGSLFRPMDQAEARAKLGIPSDKLVLLYVGALDEIHTLDAVVAATAAIGAPSVELHIVGDGPKRRAYVEGASKGLGTVIFHGRVAHHEIPHYIAAADLCLAPYNPRAFATGSLGYSTMKVPEYLSCGRPVVSLPSERMRELLREGELGFLFENTREAWQRFFQQPPTRTHLAAMGVKAATSRLPSWNETAQGYLAVCERLVAAKVRREAPSYG
jgi:glycosyltransferase involved in cell wall biosynthesis